MKRLASFVLILALSGGSAVFFAGCDQTDGATGGTAEIAAKVNAVVIPLAKVNRRIEQTLKQQQPNAKLSDLSPIELAAAQLKALDALINEEILLQRAQREQIQVTDAEVDQAVKRQIADEGLSEEDYRKKLKEAGLTEEEFRTETRHALLVSKLQEKLKAKVPAPSDKEIEEFFNQNKDQFRLERGVSLGIIAVDPADNGLKNDAIGEAQAREKITKIAERLKAGDDFATVARTVSEDIQTAQNSGDAGFFPEDILRQTFGEALAKRFFSMTEGQITEPIPGSNGRLYIFKLTGKRTEAIEPKLDNPEIRKRIVDIIRQQREQILVAALQASATNDARIENYLAQRILDNPVNFGSARPAGSALLPKSEKSAAGTSADQNTSPKPTDDKPAESKPATDKPSETKPTEGGR
ncbi:SurA N-terminal domain-containing protein [Chloracidobacterium thermophilum]|uniref:PPIC-type PPIASE domain, SurA N-terminal domain protein n=1 Tax=Chloracidobacterium thermophilum (strain B) TaxID=981222 RepID=G2LGD2_CHLTF|nr:SurA N-terminal domain-containing protein [Chloracidobacterium thermophilum]AEP10892.1 PPIC-type PPIASE domain, SurA N-terminal domain protein [Chloracidobacterium thermophilum B]QUV78821.1 SurA N-terminal domain-containing protein [Chloracidobacterium thermophilum]